MAELEHDTAGHCSTNFLASLPHKSVKQKAGRPRNY